MEGGAPTILQLGVGVVGVAVFENCVFDIILSGSHSFC